MNDGVYGQRQVGTFGAQSRLNFSSHLSDNSF